jgi:prepilin-type N-terminal cleavage/methylation domain-containing protein
MDTKKNRPKDATMMNLSNPPRFCLDSDSSGFTLVELLVASVVAGLVSTITWYIMLESTKSDIRAEFRRRLHEDWNRATTLIQSEISLSDFIQSTNLSPDQVTASGCDLLQNADEGDLKLRMHLAGTLPDIIYGVRRIGSLANEESRKWAGGPNAGVLIRCGPRMTIGENGKIEYIQGNYQQSIVLDNLDLSDGGLRIDKQNTSQKLVEFSLSMNENMNNKDSAKIRTRTLNSSAMSRINEVPPIPSEKSVCETICKVEDVDCGFGVKTLLSPRDNRVYKAPINSGSVFGTDTICTNRSLVMNDELQGAIIPRQYFSREEKVEIFYLEQQLQIFSKEDRSMMP